MKFRFWLDMKEFFHLNTRLVVAVAIGTACLIGMQFMVHSSLTECIGIADSKETLISFEVPVTVKNIYVLPGQVVKKGQPLLEVEVPEVKLKLLEVQTELQALESEMAVRNALVTTFSKSAGTVDASPLAQEIAGFKNQIAQLKAQLGQAVRYAEADGVVASVAYRPREQVQPFLPVITLTTNEPTMVYGFVNENINFEVQIGDEVMVKPVADQARTAVGRVVSVGSRIIPFPERLNTFAPGQALGMFYGRELIVALTPNNRITTGEKVHISGLGPNRASELGFQAFADSAGGAQELVSEPLASGLPLEASALLKLDTQHLLAASDEVGANGSPFWILSGEKMDQAVNIAMQSSEKIDDVESLTYDGAFYYAMGSLGVNKNGKVKKPRNQLIRFSLKGEGANRTAVVDRNVDMRDLLIDAVAKLPMLQVLSGQLQDIEVESFTAAGNDFILGLKQPQLPDGSSVVLRLVGLHGKLMANEPIVSLQAQIEAMVRLENSRCENTARISDLIRTEGGLLILANCKADEKMGQLWYVSDADPSHRANVLNDFRRGRPEGMALTADLKHLYLASDNGGSNGADLIRVSLPKLQ